MSQLSTNRHVRWALIAAPLAGVLVLAGCSGSTDDDGGSTDAPAAGVGFSIMVAQSNDADDYWGKFAAQYTDETGVEIEVIPYPGDGYNTQVTTQLQGGNAADMMILSPGTGQPISVITLAEAGFLEPLDDTSAAIIPEGTESLYDVDGEIYAQPAALTPTGLLYNAAGAADVGIENYPASYADLLAACGTARAGGKTFNVLAGSAPPNNGLLAMVISATQVYATTPDWNEQRAAGEVTFADSGWRDVLETIVEMKDTGCFQDGVEGGTFDSITQGIGGQTSLSASVPGSAAASIGGATGLDLTVQAFPASGGGKASIVASAGYAWAINAAAEDDAKESAQAFLDWAAEPEQAQAFADLAGFVPITGVTADNLPPQYQPIGELLEQGSFVEAPLATFPNPAVYDALAVGVQGLLTGQKTVDQVLDEMDAAWDA
ncbi:ABC transporter substrate-binding protein [Microbacterium pygmaeum]|uniref:Raffinose/stachyose/melibiose transport system substrate-binding protein n=1 Tax=Microbacterium pygmaeum TaxID=370764 RepID=A0A1G7VID1_9MICO|nr:ABC transporter substrate-binding protein [Microbacterium pygmaeum]SDG58690.1 raffinose/stachyose/melibiose transport system substrate-binding protein [Microbacterium pygmaeum]